MIVGNTPKANELSSWRVRGKFAERNSSTSSAIARRTSSSHPG